jgi:hypothetical protein
VRDGLGPYLSIYLLLTHLGAIAGAGLVLYLLAMPETADTARLAAGK